MKYKQIKLGGSEDYSYVRIYATQGDTGFKKYTYQIVHDDLTPVDLTGATVEFRGVNEDNELATGEATIVDPLLGVIEFKLNEEITSTNGNYKRAYFLITKGSEKFASSNIRLTLKPSADASNGQATGYINILEQLINGFKDTFNGFMTSSKAKMSEMEKRFANMLPIDGKTNIKNDSIPVNKLDFVEFGKNLFNKEDTVSGYVDPNLGIILANQAYKTSDYISIQENPITLSNIRFYALYDLNKNFISGGTLVSGQTKTITQPNKYLIRVTPFNNTLHTAQIEYGTEATSYEPYSAKLKGVTANASTSETIDINLPSKVYTTIGKTLTIYTQNLIKKDLKHYHFNYNRGTQLSTSYFEKYTSNSDLKLDVYNLDGDIIKSQTVKVIASNQRTTPIKTILIGDSTVNSENEVNGVLGRSMKNELGDNLVLLGTRGTAPYNHEGRPGWTLASYRLPSQGNITNAFYNPIKKDFDFQYYLTNNSIEKPDVVIIQLGINDVFAYSSDGAVLDSLVKIKADLKFIKDSIKSVDSNIKVAYNLPTPPTSNVDQFARNYPNTNYTQWRARLNNNLLVKHMIEEFDNTDIDLLAINASLDTVNNIRDGVHPTNEGYAQIAETLCAYLNSFN